MADKTRAGERSFFRGDAEDNDTLAEISRALDKERRAPITAVGSGFVPPPGGQASNIPAMADLEEELLREFALYDSPKVAAQPRPAVLTSPVAAAQPAPASVPTVNEDDDDTMPPMDFGASFRAVRPASPALRSEPEAPAVFEPSEEAIVDVAPEPVSVSPGFDAEPLSVHEEPVFAGPVPDLSDFDLSADDVDNEPAAHDEEPVFAGPVPDVDLADEPVFAGPVPELDFAGDLDGAPAEAEGPAFAGPVPDLDMDDETAEPVFAGPVPDFDLDVEDDVAAVAEEPHADFDDALMGELELSLGALDLATDADATPASAFATWKNDRLAGPLGGDDPVSPDWLSSPKLTPVSIPEPESIAPAMSAAPPEVVSEELPVDDASFDEGDHERLGADMSAEQEHVEPLPVFFPALDVVEPEIRPEDADIGLEAHEEDAGFEAIADDADETSEAASLAPALDTEPDISFPFIAGPRVTETQMPSEAAGPEPVFGADAPPREPALELPDWLQTARRSEAVHVDAPVMAPAAVDADNLDDFEFDFDEAAIEAEVSRAVISELESGAGKAPDEPAFDPSQISEIEERVPTSVLSMEVPSVPDHEGEAIPQAVSDFDYDIEAEMAELFAMGNKSTELGGVPGAASNGKLEEAELDPLDQGMANEIIRSIHETPAMPMGRAFSVGHGDAASSRFVSRYARLAAAAAIIAFAGVGAVLLWQKGDVPGLATDGPPRVIMADKSPIKEVPENPGGKQVPNQDKAVYDRVSGKGPEQLKQDSLIAKSEEPMNVAEKTLETDPSAAADTLAPGVAGDNAAVDTEARLPASTSSDSSAAQSNDAVAPRKVKTMIVLPNGTLVARETPEPSAPNAPAAADAKTAAAASQSPATANTNATPDAAGATAVETAAKDAPAIVAPVPVPRPAEQPVNVVGTVTQKGNVVPPQPAQKVASAAPAASAAPTPAASTVPAGSYVIQIASLPTQEEAQKSYSNLSSKFASVIGGRPVDIKAADIAGKGTFYRVRIVAGSRDDAIALCTRYKAAGGSCLVSR